MANKYALKLVLSDGTTAEAGVIEVPDGYSPVKGVDYFTDADKAAIVQDVLAAIPEWDGSHTVLPEWDGSYTITKGE